MAMQKGESARAGQVPEPDSVIRSPASQPQAIGRECQITDHFLVSRKIIDESALGEAPYPNVTVIATRDEFFSSTVEGQTVDERSIVRKHVHLFEPRCFENMNFGSGGAARQILRVRAECEAESVLVLAKADFGTKRLASFHVEDTDCIIQARGSEQSAVPRECKRAVPVVALRTAPPLG